MADLHRRGRPADRPTNADQPAKEIKRPTGEGLSLSGGGRRAGAIKQMSIALKAHAASYG